MVALPPWPAVGSLLAGLLSALFAAFLWPYRHEPGGRLFVATIAAQTLLCLSYGVALLTFDSALRFALEVPYWLGLNALAVSFLGFALAYTGRRALVRSAWFYGVAGLALASVGFLATNPIHGLAWANYHVDPAFGAATVTHSRSLWVFLDLTGAGLLVVAGVLLLVDTFLSYGPLYRDQTVAVALSTVPPMLGIYVWTFRLGPVPQLHLAPLLFPLHLAFDYYAFFRRDMFDLTPAARRAGERAAIDDLGSPVLTLDEDRRVIGRNRAASDVLGVDDSALGERLGDVLGPDLAAHFGERDDAVTIDTPAGRREFAVSTSPVRESAGEHVGYTVALQDVTEQNRRKQRLAVLNRVLRHNVRNDMTVVRGRAQAIVASADDPALVEHADAILASGDALVGLAENAREFERAMEGEVVAERVDVGSLVHDVVDDLAAGDAAVTVTVATDRDALADRALLALVLENLVENALTHAGEAPAVAVRVAAADDRVTVAVADDGPGIPDQELRSLREGESPLQHGQGLGLRVATWGMAALGGHVAFDVADGTTATVRLPAADGPGLAADEDDTAGDAPDANAD